MTLAVKKSKKYSYKDYLTWPDVERWELIGGDAYKMRIRLLMRISKEVLMIKSMQGIEIPLWEFFGVKKKVNSAYE